MPNRLAHEKSPYLLQHAHNPVDWWPWSPDALAAAQAADKPVFLSVGYSACHWCHVMERESFEDPEAAALVNAGFVPIKVDREERPDIDEIYMTAVQMMTGQGGWPMSVFLTPDGRPFFAGTYFPPESRGGRIGFKALVQQLADAWETRRDEIERIAQTIAEELETATRQRPIARDDTLPDPMNLRKKARADLEARFDEDAGGFGDAPKFPPHHALRLLLTDTDPSARRMLTTTLDKMALGGIYDHIGGGFHRYSTDRVWLLPHFEKMLYDNALLARVYAEASTQLPNAAYARIARETCDWVLRQMRDDTGGFHAALDADSEGEEGKYYVWTRAEAETRAGAAFCGTYNLLPNGNYRDEATHRLTGANIPHLVVGPADVPLPETLDPEGAAGRAALLAARAQRVPPSKDDKIIAGWNGLMIGALARAGALLDQPRYLDAARDAARFCLTTLSPDGALRRRWAQGEAAVPAFLDDHAYLADGLLDLFDATGEAPWRDAARRLCDTLIAQFWDDDDGGFFFASHTDHERLIARSKDLFDGALPSANGVAARALTRLGGFYADRARDLITTYAGVLERAPQGTATLIEAAMLAFPREAPDPLVRLEAVPPALHLAPGTDDEAAFYLTIAPGWHVNTQHPADAYLVPTIAEFTSNVPAAIGPVLYPDAIERTVAGTSLAVYEDRVAFRVPLVLAAGAPTGTYTLSLIVRFQACGDGVCLVPETRTATVTVVIA
jgi:uncharacterized protein YyaL (SSP411 family)